MVTEPEDRQRLADLEARIAALKGTQTRETPAGDDSYRQANKAWQMVTELVAGLLIGFGLGYGLDLALGTLPLFLVVLTLLGFVAGVRVMIRTAKAAQDEIGGASAADSGGDPAKDERT